MRAMGSIILPLVVEQEDSTLASVEVESVVVAAVAVDDDDFEPSDLYFFHVRLAFAQSHRPPLRVASRRTSKICVGPIRTR